MQNKDLKEIKESKSYKLLSGIRFKSYFKKHHLSEQDCSFDKKVILLSKMNKMLHKFFMESLIDMQIATKSFLLFQLLRVKNKLMKILL